MTGDTNWQRDLAATAAITCYTVAVGVGFARVFSGWPFLRDMIAIAVVGHGVSFALRRLRVSGWIAIPAVALVLVWVLATLYYPDSSSAGIVPWSATWDQVTADLALVRDGFPTAVAPVAHTREWAALSGFAIALVLVMADSFAFRAEARGEALVPGGVLFVFIAALGDERLRVASTGFLIAAGVVAVVALRQLHQSRRAPSVTVGRAVSFALPAAIATAVTVALVGGVVGPRIPGADAEALYDTTSGGTTNVLNPLVDIRARLTNRGNVELFRVNADAPAYWRVMTLAEFNGEQFRLPERSLEPVPEVAPDPAARRLRQKIQIISLGGTSVPAAADPIAVSPEGVVRREPQSRTLIAPAPLEPGDEFEIVSSAPVLTADDLRGRTALAPPDPIYLELPDDLPSIVGEMAQLVAGDAGSPYDAARAMQAWFRTDSEWEYSTEVVSGHSTNAIESFFRERIGYCEQFSATFAAMARTLGIPSRVAVGYTTGTLRADGFYSVIGKNAHAWPELWFDGIGWVAFEPTPGRGQPGLEDVTGLPAEQDTSGPDPVGGDGDGGASGDGSIAPNPTTPPTVVEPGADSGGPTTTLAAPSSGADPLPPGGFTPDRLPGQDELADAEAAAAAESESFPWTTMLVAGAIALALAAPALARRARRARIASLPGRDRVVGAWERARTAAIDAGVVGTSSMTPHEWAMATATVLPVAARPMSSLADTVDRVVFAPPDAVDLERQGTLGDRLSDDCSLWADQVRRIAVDTMSTPQRIRRYFSDRG